MRDVRLDQQGATGEGADALHHPVMLADVLDLLQPRAGRVIAEGTIGYGGHTSRILATGASVIGTDQDTTALAAAAARLAPLVADDPSRLQLHHARFSQLADILGDRKVDGILLDIGVSSPQLDQGERGFSFRFDGPLDMRMDPSSGVPASEWLEQVTEEELADVLFQFGEERASRRVSRAILAALPITTTRQLAAVVERVLPPDGRLHPATRTFQAIRIAVNDELGELDRALARLPDCLAPGGRLAIISFHSLEDRRVKQAFQARAAVEIDPIRGRPLHPPSFQLVERKARKGEDRDAHPRARSARLRALERCL